MARFRGALALLALATVASADLHHLFVGTWKTKHLFSLEYDTNSNTFSQTGVTIAKKNGQPWLALSHDKSTLYATERDGWASYKVVSPRELRFLGQVDIGSQCGSSQDQHGQTVLYASPVSPYPVYGAGKPPCAAVVGVKGDGSLNGVIQTTKYHSDSRIQGIAMDYRHGLLYTADQKGNGIWVHKIDRGTGKLDAGKFFESPIKNSRPRRIALHPDGRYLYILLMKQATLAMAEVVPQGNGVPELRWTGVNFGLAPQGEKPKSYKPHDVVLNPEGTVLYATVKYKAQNNQNVDDEDEEVEIEEEVDEESWSNSWRNIGNSNEGGWRNRNNTWDEDEEERWGRGRGWQGDGEEEESSRRGRGRGWSDEEEDSRRGRGRGRSDEEEDSRRGRWDRRDQDWNFKALARRTLFPDTFMAGEKTLKRATQTSGGLSVIKLADPAGGTAADGRTKGYPEQVVLQVGTSTGGGNSNAVALAPWGNGDLVLTDSELGLVQLWHLDGLDDLPRDWSQYRGNVNVRASIVAEWQAPADAIGTSKRRKFKRWPWEVFRRADAAEAAKVNQGCCANPVWYD